MSKQTSSLCEKKIPINFIKEREKRQRHELDLNIFSTNFQSNFYLENIMNQI